MAKTTFVSGMNLEAEFLNAINNPQFVEVADNDGEIPLITNNNLSNAAGQIKPEWVAFRDELKISASTGLSVTYAGGIVVLPNGTQQTIAPGTLALPNNATSVIYIDTTGAIAAATTPPVSHLPLARVVTAAGVISGAIVDLRPRFRILPRVDAIKVFGGSGDEGAYTLNSGSATLTEGEYWFSSFLLGSAATLTIPAGCRIYVSGAVSISGTINISAPVQGVGGGTFGGISGGGFIASTPGRGQGAGSGSGGGSAYNYSLSNLGSSGSTGSIFFSGTGGSASFQGSGAGGGFLLIEAGGSITIASGATITAKGGDASINLVSNTTNVTAVTGNGGGSGGIVILKSLLSVAIAGTIDVRGGAGSAFAHNATPASNIAYGGGGGGGGQIVVMSPSNNITGSILLSGGAAGASSGTGVPLGGGAGGGCGGAGGNGAPTTAGGVGQLITRNFKAVA